MAVANDTTGARVYPAGHELATNANANLATETALAKTYPAGQEPTVVVAK